MMTHSILIQILKEAAVASGQLLQAESLVRLENVNRNYSPNEVDEFVRDLNEAASKTNLMLLEQSLDYSDWKNLILKQGYILFTLTQDGPTVAPELWYRSGGEVKRFFYSSQDPGFERIKPSDLPERSSSRCFAIVPFRSLVSEKERTGAGPHPVRRLLHLLASERKDILYLLVYALMVGGIGLIIPLGIQTTVELVSGGLFFSSVYVMIGLVVVGVLLAGILQIVQMNLVEYLQRRVFARAAYEFAYRVPRIRMESLHRRYAPELINRFFDVISIQKGLPKLLLELSSAALQILFALALLSLYHPLFILFGLSLILGFLIIFRLTGPRGLESSIEESKYKYKVVHWLEELGRALNSFKLSGNSQLAIRKTDSALSGYLAHRKSHFGVLMTQFTYVVIFKALIVAALLFIGTWLVLQREITLGQFVASEIIIILILSAVEKIVINVDVVFDLLTAVDKVGQVTDLPIEQSGGLDLPGQPVPPIQVSFQDVHFQYSDSNSYELKSITLDIQSGERVCVAGPGNSGKTTLTNLIAGLTSAYEGAIQFNGHSLHDLDLTHLRDHVGKNISSEDLFDGSIIENITVGNPRIQIENVLDALRSVGLYNDISRFRKGLETPIAAGGRGYSNSFTHRLILARCLAKRPALLVLNDLFTGMSKAEKLALIQEVVKRPSPWTLVVVSNDPLVMAACDRVIVIRQGSIAAEGSFKALIESQHLQDCIE